MVRRKPSSPLSFRAWVAARAPRAGYVLALAITIASSPGLIAGTGAVLRLFDRVTTLEQQVHGIETRSDALTPMRNREHDELVDRVRMLENRKPTN